MVLEMAPKGRSIFRIGDPERNGAGPAVMVVIPGLRYY